MNFRVQRLVRGQRLLPQLTKRFISSHVPEASIVENTSTVESGSVEAVQSTPDVSRILEAGKEALRSAETIPETPLHSILAAPYASGVGLRRSFDALDRIDENLCPKWGSSGIPLKVRNSTGSTTIIDLPHFWLRDNCRCPTCVNQDTRQRAFETFSINLEIEPEEVVTEKEGLRVKWSDDGHISIYPWDWIFRHAPSHISLDNKRQRKVKESKPKLWDSSIASDPPSVAYDEVMSDDTGVGKMLAKIREYGFCYVDGCPVSPEKTEELLERIAFIRVTHYGGFYDFTADLTMKDTAYTNLALPAHTDNTYFTDPSGLQAFHLLSHTEGTGGESLLVDGFNAASKLKKSSRISFDQLATWPIPWHASGNEGKTIVPFKKFPVFEFGDLKEGRKPELTRIRWNNDDRGVVDLRGNLGMTAGKWYKAAAAWNKILTSEDMQYWAQLKPGRPLIFDNWRVLHGRSAFTGKRRICGGYINHDDYISRWRNTNYTREEALSQIL